MPAFKTLANNTVCTASWIFGILFWVRSATPLKVPPGAMCSLAPPTSGCRPPLQRCAVLAARERTKRTWTTSPFRTCWSGRTGRASGGPGSSRRRRTVRWTCRGFRSTRSSVRCPSSRGRWTVRRWTWRRWTRASIWRSTSAVVNGTS